MARYRYRFDFLDGWLPDERGRRELEYDMSSVVPAAEFRWDLGGGHDPFVEVIIDLDERLPLEGIAVLAQAFNTAFVYVAGWPPQMQSCVSRQIGGAYAPPVAVGTVLASAMTPV